MGWVYHGRRIRRIRRVGWIMDRMRKRRNLSIPRDRDCINTEKAFINSWRRARYNFFGNLFKIPYQSYLSYGSTWYFL
jgi:hypothetical protein